MHEYEVKVYDELQVWRTQIMKQSGLMNRLAKKAQVKINEKIPEKAHAIITESIKQMIKATLVGSNITTKKVYPTIGS